MAKDLKQQTPPDETRPATTTPSLRPFTNTDNVVVEQIMEVILQSGLSPQQAKVLIERTIPLLEWGQKAAPKTTH